MEMWNAQTLYKNSLMKFSKTLEINLNGNSIEVYKYLLDKRFISATITDLKDVFLKCKIKDDPCWYVVYSPIYLNNDAVFNNLGSLDLLISLEEFIELVG